MKSFLLLFLLLFTGLVSGQDIIEMPDGTSGNVRFVGCDPDIFTDSGGISNSYSSNESGQITFCPVIQTDRMTFDFNSLQLGPNDLLRVYDGDSTAAPLLTTFSTSSIPSAVVSASPGNPTGCLTFTFVSNGSDNRAGWEATRSCVDPCQTITPSITTTPPRDADGILRICQGDTVQFNGQATFSNDGTGATYEWDFDNGRGLNPGQSQSETFNEAGSYQARFIVTDNTGCTDRDLIDLVIQVSNDPDFTGTTTQDQEICLGETTTLTGMVETVEFVVTPAPPVSGTTFLPDGDGVSYETCIDVQGFSPGATFTDASNLVSLFIDLEHSWASDLDIIITAPNGSSVEILGSGQSGSNKRFGNPNFTDSGGQPNNPAVNPPGTGFEYVIRESAPATNTFQNAVANISPGSSLPAGSYLPTDPFSNFIGSNLNGQWCLRVTDNISLDNGYIFEWGLNFDPTLLPANLSFEPNKVREEWQADPTIIATNGNEITVQPDVSGTKCYTYEFEDSFGCIYTEEVCIQVNPTPNPNDPEDLMICDTVGSVNTVDLTQNTAVMLAGQNSNNFQVAYYRQLTDAENLTNPIANPSQFAAQNTAETIYTSITNGSNGCSVVRDFQVSINQAIYTFPGNLSVCDDASNDGVETFDLSAQTPTILGTQSTAEVTVTYHRTQADAQSGANPIVNTANYSNENSPTQIVYVRVENNIDNGCFATGDFTLTVGGNPVANPIATYRVCDDASNDGRAVFQLQTRDSEILLGQSAADYEVTYYLSSNDAASRQNPIDKTSFQNTTNPQNIVARIDSRFNTSCFETTDFDLVVDPLPVLQRPNPLVSCDDPSGDGSEVFDLTSNNTSILNGLNSADFDITYYLSQADATAANNSIASSYTSNVPTDIVYVRVENNLTDCFSTTDFEIIINPVPAVAAVPNLETCDTDNDGTAIFRLNDRLDQIRNGQSGVEVTFFNSQADALSDSNSLDAESYSSSGLETIFYRTEFTSTGCFTTSSFDIETITPPVAAMPAAVELCDSGDGTAVYNLANSDAQIQNGQTNTTVTYYQTQADADADRSAIDKNFSFSGDVTLFARLENSSGCYTTTTLELRFGQLPLPQLEDEVVLCRDPQGQLVNGPAVLDTGLSDADFDFEWRFDGQLLPMETNSVLITEQQGTYEVTAFNAVTGCSTMAMTVVRLAGAPDTFTIDITSEPFELNQQIVIDAVGPDDYWFQLDGGLYKDSNIFENVSPGVHFVTIAERNGCGSVTTQIFVYGYPKFFTPNFDGFNDTWNVAAGDRLPVLNIYIYDRYGKFLKQLDPTGAGWDGTYLGELLPSSDYWFKLEYEYEGTTGAANGHFSLKR
ncbi:hypothetical protein AAU57_14250 [Nonlabens sp. YIK11]|uniref:T9SS type B sorting domain-containing protein n=1 Tax=Nonlabens sp. YIK11 TaxID=1453349 RepID=UPI0006DC608A|nr:T9SS type B sorting domain-containing protein [Nonlabens sp. YIK11]KQC34369.1 hypothetical protein AAU57_14250 [Nonlabens sp. YIK11]